MGVCYDLHNNTKKESVTVDTFCKFYAIQSAPVSYALVMYMLENLGDDLQFLDDRGDDREDERYNYKQINLLKYPFQNPNVIGNIVEKLNIWCGFEQFKIMNEVVMYTKQEKCEWKNLEQ